MNRSLVGLLAVAALLSLGGFLRQELVALRHRAPRRTAERRVVVEPASGAVNEADSLRDLPLVTGHNDLESPRRTLPGEFEPQSALLVTCRELVPLLPDVFARIVSAASGTMTVMVLVSDDAEREFVFSTLDDYGLSRDSVQFVEAKHDTMWIRDYGPVVARNEDGSRVILDAVYDSEERQEDDQVPTRVARQLGMGRIRVPVEVDGGNLLANGEGICLSTVQLLVENDTSAREVRRALALYYGCENTVLLEPLVGEETGHVDMFATFTSRDTVVVGSYDPEVDAENAAVLDRNAAELSEVETRTGPLRVVRIPMPARTQEEWRTYTNVIFANGRLLVPVYSDDDPGDRKRALATYSSLLPRWEMITIDVSELVPSGGALHCISRNVESGGPRQACAPVGLLRPVAEGAHGSPRRSAGGSSSRGRGDRE